MITGVGRTECEFAGCGTFRVDDAVVVVKDFLYRNPDADVGGGVEGVRIRVELLGFVMACIGELVP